jgi:dTDP-glucose 4,6-dehydratase
MFKKKPIPVYDKGINVKDSIHVQDHVDAIYKICLSNFKKETFLIGGRNKILNIKLVYKICEKFDETTGSLKSK